MKKTLVVFAILAAITLAFLAGRTLNANNGSIQRTQLSNSLSCAANPKPQQWEYATYSIAEVLEGRLLAWQAPCGFVMDTNALEFGAKLGVESRKMSTRAVADTVAIEGWELFFIEDYYDSAI